MPPQDTKGQSSSLSDAINMLMANPEIISTVASALGNMPQRSENTSKTEDLDVSNVQQTEGQEIATDSTATSAAAPTPDLSALISTLSPLMSGLSGGSHSSEKTRNDTEAHRREALLCALKPYVSEGRRDAIDYIIRISRMSEVLKTIQS